MVIDQSFLVLYKSPGTMPSFIVPLRSTSQLRSISMSSASGIVGNHIQQKGFAVFDSTEGTGLFFVAANDSEYNMWVEAISAVLKKEEATNPADRIVSENTNSINQNGGASLSITDQLAPPTTALTEDVHYEDKEAEAQHDVDPFDASDKVLLSALPQEPKIDPYAATEPSPVAAASDDALGKGVASLDSFDHMDDVEMDDISLSGSDKHPHDSATYNDGFSSTQLPVQQPTPLPPHSQSIPQNANAQTTPMRERLALAKGLAKGKTAKLASSKFGSAALKTAKGGMIAASEISRDVKQAVTKEIHTPRRGGEEPTKRSLAIDKVSMLKKNAGAKLTTVRASLQDQPLIKRVNTADSLEPPPHAPASSHDGSSPNRSSKQELRKKLANLDQSVSNTVRRLKIDEKVHQLSAAVKSDPMVRQLSNLSHSRQSEHARHRLGIGDESKSLKAIKFDARQTFGASSELPLKVKNVFSGDALLIDDTLLLGQIESRRKIGGSWVVAVDATKVIIRPLIIPSSSNVSSGNNLPPSIDPQTTSADNQVNYQWKYRITATDIGCETSSKVEVERTISEILVFHTSISEIIANNLPSASEVLAQGVTHDSHLDKLSPVDRLRVSGTLLQRVLDVDKGSATSPLRDNHCHLMKTFISTLLDCPLPVEALGATKIFLNIDDSISEVSDDYGTYLINGTHSAVDDAFGLVSQAMSVETYGPISSTNSLDLDPKAEGVQSLMDVIMDGYTKAIQERDQALASLATTSIINDNRLVQEQLVGSNQSSGSQMNNESSHMSSDEDMINLCKELGKEISVRTAAETEINRLNERLEFERKIAEAKEKELREELARYKKE